MTASSAPASASPVAGAKSSARRVSPAACLGAALLGMLLLYGVGFSQPTVAHNAAHDARHAQGFPCH